MIRKVLKRMLGVDDLENKVEFLQNRVSEQDGQIIDAAKQRELIRKSTSDRELSDAVIDFLNESDIEITSENRENALVAMDAAEAVERYGFRKFNPAHDGNAIRSSVISLREFAENPEKYIHKSAKGAFSFPLSLNYKNLESLFENYGNIGISSWGIEDFAFCSLPGSIEGHYSDSREVSKTLYNSLTLARANREFSDRALRMDPLDFLQNYEGLTEFIKDAPLEDKKKREILEAMALSKATYIAGFDITYGTRIMSTEDLVSYEEPEESEYVQLKSGGRTDAERIYDDIKEKLLSGMRGMRDYDMNELLPIRSVEEFRRLASERTTEIVARDGANEGLTASFNKELSEYTPAEAVLMSCYFARNIIKSYKKEKDSINDLLNGIMPSGVEGKCTDYTGLALHYLREFIVPLNPERFKHWEFGYEVDRIGNDYNHCYMKAIHENPDGSHDVFFIDPTSLSSLDIDNLKTPENIAEYASTENHPVKIIRDAEDLLYDKLES